MFRANAQPPTAATAPTRSAADVISIFSDAYTNISGTNFNPNWGQGTQVSDTVVSGDNIMKYHRLDYQGTQLGSRVNASAMENIHFDIWTPNATQIQIFMVNEGNTGGPVEQSVTRTLTQNGWNSIDIPMTSYHASIISSISQFKIQVPGFSYQNSPFIYYLDNIYFWKSANIPTLSGFSFATKFTNDAPFKITAPTSNSNGAFSYTSSNTNVATISGDTITIVSAGTSIITANQAADGSFAAASTTATLTVTFAPPTDAPATPTLAAGNVISIFSNAYTNISGINFNPGWGQATQVLDMNIAGNDIKRYSNFNYQGTEFVDNSLNVSTMDSLHFDIWTPNLNSFRVSLISFSPTVERPVTVTPTKNGWNRISIALSAFSGVNKSNVRQFKYDQGSPANATFYLDNIYFSKIPGSPTITGFSVGNRFLGDAPFTITAPQSTSNGAFSYTSSNTNVATISGDQVTIVGLGTTTITANQAADAPFLAGSITTLLNVRYAPPTMAADTPTLNPSEVLSLFSDSYTNVTGTDWYPNWGQSTVVTDILVGGNTTKRYDNLNYQGVQFSSPVNASAHNHLHLDLYTPNCTTFRVFLISDIGVERQVTLTPTLNGWNSFNIPLSSFAGIRLNNITQMKFEGVPSGSSAVFLDNLYFWTATVPTLTGFTVTDKVLGDAPFALTAPNSNSSGTFSYSSSNTSVATISGNTVTVVGVGSTIITATQTSVGSFGSATITATLNVTLPVLPQAPSTAATTPTRPAFNVYSLFSNTYTNISGTNFNPNWGQSTQVADTTIDGNTTKKYTNLNYQGIQFASTIDASPASYLHVDIWTANCTKFELFLINTATGAEQPYAITPTLAGWNSVDIPLSAYSPSIVNHVNQIKLVGTPFGGGTKVYMDNLYFWANTCINVVTQPSVSLIESANNVCSGTSVTLTAIPTNGGANPSYNFKVNGMSVQNGSSNTYASSTLMNNDAVTCVITRTDGCANDGNSNTVTMMIKANPNAGTVSSQIATNTTSVALCNIGQSVTLYPSVAGGVWSNSNASSVSISGTNASGSASRTIAAIANGISNISYTVSSATTGCSSAITIPVTVATIAAPNAISGANTVCVNNSITLSTTSTGGNWVSNGRGTINASGLFTATAAGTTSVKYVVTNASGCSNAVSYNLTVNALPAIPSIAYAPGTTNVQGSGGLCKNRTFTVVGSPTGGVWSKTGVITISNLGVISTGNTTGAMTVSYTITNANGCTNARTIGMNVVNCSSKGINQTVSTSNENLLLYPNPAKGVVNFNVNKLVGEGKVIITDLLGKQVVTKTISLGNNSVDISKLNKGCYIVTIATTEGNKTNKLFVD
ncbi:MAG: T9SS type A sorting domain-containing protein [Bacteroidetes bacterium]|nr:T9SS type A sorting domain-containing protein [Bacteroidota bacterium]